DAKSASNPFITFKELPASARYKFMLQEAEFTIMGYIKGPVCRGQVALNVIEDHFWVFFVDPDIPTMLYQPARAESYAGNLRLPAEDRSTASPFKIWT
ncbi:fatty acid cis/trans isomerase, partial [Oleiphilus sp. HI0067]